VEGGPAGLSLERTHCGTRAATGGWRSVTIFVVEASTPDLAAVKPLGEAADDWAGNLGGALTDVE
jgi:hypothetical protein